MPELNFDQLPLVEVVCRFILEKRLPVDPAMLVDFVSASKDRFPIVREPSETPARLDGPLKIEVATSVGGFSVANSEGVEISVQRGAVVVKWSGELGDEGTPDPPYPRYETSLRGAVVEAFRVLGDLLGGEAVQVRIVNMEYTNLVTYSGPIGRDGITSRFATFDPVSLPGFQSFQTFNCSYRNQRGIDVRLTYDATVSPVEGYLASCIAGRFLESPVGSGEALEILDTVRQTCNETFDRTLTSEARVEWKQR